MATTAGFKQQCPSCEAMVPIRDTKLIGRKIDCPKCKYRFLVEEPQDSEEEDAEEPQPVGKARRAEGDKGRAKGKGGKGPRRGRDDEDEGPPPKAKGGVNTKVLLGAGLGALALVVLAVVGIWFAMSGGDGKSTSNQRAAASNPVSTSSDQTKEEKPVAAAATALPAEFLTNLLPPDTEGVCTIHVKSLLGTALGRAIFDTPGGFRAVSLSRRLGVPVDDLDLVVQAWNFTQNWSMTIVHTDKKPLELDRIQKALRAKPADKKIEDQEYYVLDSNAWLDQLGRTTFSLLLQTPPGQVPARSGPLALYKFDDQTLLVADVKPMQEFLKYKGAFAHQSEAGKPEESPQQPEEQAPEQGGPGRGRGGMANPQEQMRRMMMGRGMRGGMGGPQPGAGGTEEPKPAEETAVPSGSYLTISPALKTMLDRVEGKEPVVSLALDTSAADKGNVKVLGVNPLNLRVLFEEAGIIGAALQMKNNIVLRLGATYASEGDAQKHLSSMKSVDVPDLAKALAQALNTKVEKVEDEAGDQGTVGVGPGRQGPGGYGQMSPMGGGPGGFMQMQQQQQRRMQRMMMGGPMGPGGMGQFGQPPPAQEKKEPEKPASTIKITSPDKTMLVLTVTLVDPVANSDFLDGTFRNLVLKRKGYLDMASRQTGFHELAAAARAYADAHQGQFPRGTAQRDLPTPRLGRPFPPDERVSWLVELLPYLGAEQEALYKRIFPNKSWQDPDNLLAARTLIPQFLDPAYPESTWWVSYPGLQEQVAATDVVGIAGVGLGAAEYDPSDPAVASKIGVFGYDRVTKLSDLANKGGNTILFVQVPPTFKRPWLAGGGSTVQGVPEHNSIQPFVSGERDGKRGTLVAMADGSVRFVSEKISDDAFKAMCTIKGGLDVNVNRDAPIVAPTESAEPKFVEPTISADEARHRVRAVSPKPPSQPARSPTSAPAAASDKVATILWNHCGECHTGATAKKKVQIFVSERTLNPGLPRDKVRQVLDTGKMPPRMKPRLQPDELAALQEWLTAAN
jgi:Protein of unknown function (DUF1559)